MPFLFKMYCARPAVFTTYHFAINDAQIVLPSLVRKRRFAILYAQTPFCSNVLPTGCAYSVSWISRFVCVYGVYCTPTMSNMRFEARTESVSAYLSS